MRINIDFDSQNKTNDRPFAIHNNTRMLRQLKLQRALFGDCRNFSYLCSQKKRKDKDAEGKEQGRCLPRESL